MTKNTDEKLNIQEAIKAFGSDDITNAGINLFSVLGYDTSLQAPLDKKTYSEFQENYIDASPAADRFSEEKARVSDWKSIDILFQLTNDSFNGAKSLFEESVNPTDMQSYLCFAIELKENEYSKTQIANVTREINKLFSIPIIIIYKYGKNLTLAIINRRVNKCDNDRDVLEKVTLIKDIFYEKPHRAHIEILFDMSLAQLSTEYTIYNFETLHKAWSEVLDTQALNKRFYTELSNWYFWAIKTVVYPGYEMESEKNGLFTKEDKLREHNAKNLIRLLTRLLFVWFIKEKDLIPEELFDEQSINDLITSFEPNKYYFFDTINKESKSVYYKAILQNLFFASLNAEQGKRAFRLDGQNQNATSLMRYKRYHKNPESFVKLIESKVPFMNGGLFECLDSQDDEKKGKKGGAIINYEDGFSDRKDNKLFVPDYIFFGKDVKVDLSSEYDDKKKKDVTVNGIINILQKYKFTIAENTPVEEDIALDPELLGRVFENLLASYNPETKTNARKQTGSFYTPRPIVEYMVDESLKAYLKTKIKDAAQHNGISHSDTERPSERSEESYNKRDVSLEAQHDGVSPSEYGEESINTSTTPLYEIKFNENQNAINAKGFIYIVTNKNKTTLYIGVTSDLKKRIYEHKNHVVEGFTDKYNCENLVYFECFTDIKSAIEREKYLKGKKRDFKENLINSINPKWIDLYDYLFKDVSPEAQHNGVSPSDTERPSERSEESYNKRDVSPEAQHDGISPSDTERPSERSEESLDSKLDNLISYNENEPEFTEEERFQILKYIDECKILDPACGSGAFPMGILQKMVYVIHKLDPQNDNWKQIQIQKISNDSKLTPKEKNELQKEILTVFDDNELDYARKLYLIENCIHGIDIQPIATQISRLRFFISLIVDQKVDEKKPNFGVRPLPNLENRFVTANSLIGLDNQTGYLAENEIGDLKEELKTIRHKLFNAKSPAYKFELKQKDKEIRGEIERVLLESGFGKENASMISTWDPYDKNKSAEFFDAEWMFGIKAPSHSERSKESYNKRDVSPEAQHDGGFDIVIGNPPYVQVKKGIVTKEQYPYSEGKDVGKQNLYKLFVEASYNYLKQGGISTLIVQSSLMCDMSSAFTRELLLTKTVLLQIIEFPKVAPHDNSQVFKAVLQGTCISIFTKKIPNEITTFGISINNDTSTINSLEFELSNQFELKTYFSSRFEIPLINKGEMSIISKVKNHPKLQAKITDSLQGNINTIYLKDIQSNEKTDIFIAKGANVHKYFIDNDVLFGKKSLQVKNLVKRNYDAGAVLVTQNITGTTDKFRIHAAYAECKNTSFVFLHSVNILYLPNPSNAKLILALLNSKLLDWLFRKTSTNNHCNMYELVDLPIPNTTPEQQQEIIDLVDKILAAKRCFANAQHDSHSDQSHDGHSEQSHDGHSDQSHDSHSEQSHDSHSEQSHDSHSEQSEESTDTTALEYKIDELVYKLYGLTEEEIAVVEGK